jgi:DNA (cytosine-5)-methyltransferase 1
MNVVSFFAGCGGLDLGFEQAGFQVVWANEIESHYQATYIRNHPNTEFVLGDVCKIDPNTIPDCDGFVGGPPCQSWSVGGKQKGLDDERGLLFLKYIELINAKKPKFFVIENVKGMLDDKFKDVFDDFILRLNKAGYDVQWALLDAVNYRIPQNRERVFFVGFRKELHVKFIFPTPTCTEPITLERAIGDIKEVPVFYSGSKEKVIKDFNCRFSNHDVLTSKFGPFYYRGNRRRGWQQPSFTINATADYAPLHPSSPKMLYYGHENWNFQKDKLSTYRRMSVRECARIQSFPDSFIFEYENIKDAYKMIGNAVPPRLGFEIAKSIIATLNHLEVSSTTTHVQARDQRGNTILVGYHKGSWHKQLILKNQIYYVRSDGRKGSMFKEDCSVIPRYLLLHHKDDAFIYELEAEEPILADAAFLKSLGFVTSGETYLCFRLKSAEPVTFQNNGGEKAVLNYNKNNYSPFFTTIDKVFY